MIIILLILYVMNLFINNQEQDMIKMNWTRQKESHQKILGNKHA